MHFEAKNNNSLTKCIFIFSSALDFGENLNVKLQFIFLINFGNKDAGMSKIYLKIIFENFISIIFCHAE